jgi:putative ABC transport system permease protein
MDDAQPALTTEGSDISGIRVVSAALFDVRAGDPAMYAAAAVSMAAIAAVATVLPARRALSVDPMIALRHD